MALGLAEDACDDTTRRFWRDGFIEIADVFDAAELEAFRAALCVPAIRDEQLRRGRDEKLLHLLEITARQPLFLELARDPRIVDRVARLIGPDLQLQHSKVTTKPPTEGRGAAPWHQDFAYFPHSNADLVAVMVALDDATPDNGCLHVVPGSHELGPLDHTEGGYFTGACSETEHFADASRHVPIELDAGSLSIHHAFTLHSSPENRIGTERRALVFQYRAADAFQLGGDVWLDTGLQVRGSISEVARCESLAAPLPKRRGLEQPYGTCWNQVGGLARAHNLRHPCPTGADRKETR